MTDRRQFLTAAGTGLAALLAGCSGRRGGVADESATETPVETTARTETATSTPTATDTQTPTESGDGYDDGYGSDYGGGGDTPTATQTTTETPTATQTATTVQVVADNVRASAWEFVGDSGIGDGENPTITLEPGTRYVVENRGWSAHPFAFLTDDGTSLLTQEDGGTFADDPEVDWRDDGGEFAFTLTAELAEAVDRYVCTVHARMQGDVETA